MILWGACLFSLGVRFENVCFLHRKQLKSWNLQPPHPHAAILTLFKLLWVCWGGCACNGDAEWLRVSMCRRSGLVGGDTGREGGGAHGSFPMCCHCVGGEWSVCVIVVNIRLLSAFSPDTKLFFGYFTVWIDIKPMPELSAISYFWGTKSRTWLSPWDMMLCGVCLHP